MAEIRKYLLRYTSYDPYTKNVEELNHCIEAYTAEDAVTQYKALLPTNSKYIYRLISIGPYKEKFSSHGSN